MQNIISGSEVVKPQNGQRFSEGAEGVGSTALPPAELSRRLPQLLQNTASGSVMRMPH